MNNPTFNIADDIWVELQERHVNKRTFPIGIVHCKPEFWTARELGSQSPFIVQARTKVGEMIREHPAHASLRSAAWIIDMNLPPLTKESVENWFSKSSDSMSTAQAVETFGYPTFSIMVIPNGSSWNIDLYQSKIDPSSEIMWYADDLDSAMKLVDELMDIVHG